METELIVTTYLVNLFLSALPELSEEQIARLQSNIYEKLIKLTIDI